MARTVPGVRAESDPRYLWPLLAAAMRACADAAVIGQAGRTGDLAAVRDGLEQLAAGTVQLGPVERAHAAVFIAEAARAAGHLDLAAWDGAGAAWDAIGQPYPLAYTLLQAARAAVGEGDRAAAAAGCPGRRNWRPGWVPGRCSRRSPGLPAGRGSTCRTPQARPDRPHRSG